MADGRNITHPFQNDGGTSQLQRLMPNLTDDAPRIDGRTLADLLQYFTQLSSHINYYDKDMMTGDWQPFFNNSLPFSLAAISKYDMKSVDDKLALYRSLFARRPGRNTLQLLVHFMYYSTVYRINTWYGKVKDSGLPFESVLHNLVQERFLDSMRSFIALANSAAREACIRTIDFSALTTTGLWNLSASDLKATDTSRRPRRGRRARLFGLADALAALWPSFTEAMKLLSSIAPDSIEDSLFHQSDMQKEKHTPHLALVFSFLKLFQHLQSDLNGFTRKHLDFFFRTILRLAPRPAQPDKAFIVFEIQKQLDDYLLTKGLLVKDAKDRNNVEIQFALDDEIVVNQAQVQEVRTLFLDSSLANDRMDVHLLQGVYMAPKADKADGITKDFADGTPTNWPTLGARSSKFTNVGKTEPENYPFARIGFVLASPVLLLNEGRRTVKINLYCTSNGNCLSTHEPNMLVQFLGALQTAMGQSFIILTRDLIDTAAKAGLLPATITKMVNLLPLIPKALCCPDDQPGRETRVQLLQSEWESSVRSTATAAERVVLDTIFLTRRVLRISFSGKKDWIDPTAIELMSIDPKGSDYLIKLHVRLDEDKPAVTFFNKIALKEDFDTQLPLVKIELDPEIVVDYPGMPGNKDQQSHCCFENCPPEGSQHIALYQFFRQLTLSAGTLPDVTQVEVDVCGLKNLIVQNDENLMDVNGPIYPFGTRPKVPDFEKINPPVIVPVNPNMSGPSFYIGSQEIFCKKWSDVRVNLNWKDKPGDFKDYYRAYYTDPANPTTVYGLEESGFRMELSYLRDGRWIDEAAKRQLFDTMPSMPLCAPVSDFEQTIGISYDKTLLNDAVFRINPDPLDRLDVSTRNGFIRINLRDQDFLHKDYAFVMARQMMAFGRFPDALIEGAVYVGSGNTVIVFNNLGNVLLDLKDEIENSEQAALAAKAITDMLNNTYNAAITPPGSPITNPERDIITPLVHQTQLDVDDAATQASTTKNKLDTLSTLLNIFDFTSSPIKLKKDLQVLIPNEPWTPQIKNISLDYVAAAQLSDLEFFHLYPFENTHKKEEATLQPALFPTHCDQGSLFIGLKQLVPGNNLNLLFQLAEATANSEADRADVQWQYLAANQWRPLRPGFEVLDDGTLGLTTSGIVKLALPANIDKANTILPNELHWLKVSAAQNVVAISETIGIHTQAVQASFSNTPAHDQLRLASPLDAAKLSKLVVADAAVKKVAQPYASFGGAVPEGEGNYYTRVSELLRHKGRGIQKFDYERLVLDAFPEIYKVKCINHDFWLDATRYRLDVNAAPGYVLVAVIPDLRRLESGRSFEPKAPVSVLERITHYLKSRTSPFARIKVANPRYEKLDLCITVQLYKGRDRVYYKSRLESDLRLFLAPWAVGEFDKLSFGQCINRSDIVRFIEGRDYVDYILCLKMLFATDCGSKTLETNEVCPLTPRSILVGGFIDICIPEKDCEQWAREPKDMCSTNYDLTTVACPEPPPIK